MTCPVHHSEHFGVPHTKAHAALAMHPDCTCHSRRSWWNPFSWGKQARPVKRARSARSARSAASSTIAASSSPEVYLTRSEVHVLYSLMMWGIKEFNAQEDKYVRSLFKIQPDWASMEATPERQTEATMSQPIHGEYASDTKPWQNILYYGLSEKYGDRIMEYVFSKDYLTRWNMITPRISVDRVMKDWAEKSYDKLVDLGAPDYERKESWKAMQRAEEKWVAGNDALL